MYRPAIHSPNPNNPHTAWIGPAIRTSRRTPESEVYVDAPVKPIARKLDTATNMKNHPPTLSRLKKNPGLFNE